MHTVVAPHKSKHTRNLVAAPHTREHTRSLTVALHKREYPQEGPTHSTSIHFVPLTSWSTYILAHLHRGPPTFWSTYILVEIHFGRRICVFFPIPISLYAGTLASHVISRQLLRWCNLSWSAAFQTTNNCLIGKYVVFPTRQYVRDVRSVRALQYAEMGIGPCITS